MLSHYHSAIDPENENNSHACILRMVGFNKRVLEAGCASGHVSEILNARGCSVVGVEIDPMVVRSAEQWLERAIVGDLDDESLWLKLEGETFDAILFGDVLEHLKDPLRTLRESAKHLRPSGVVIISVPNIAHADVKIALLNGTFPYGESGLLDSTHVHFFTKGSLLEMVHQAGLVPVEVCRITAPVFTTEIGVQRGDIDDQVLEKVLDDRESETYQFVIKAVRDDGARAIENLSADLVGLTDKLHDQSRQIGALQAEHAALQAKFEALQAKNEADVQQLTHARGQIDTVKRLVPSPILRFARRLLGR